MQICQSEEVFLNLEQEAKDPRAAWASKKIRVQGEVTKLKALRDLMGLMAAAGQGDPLGGARLVPRDKWQPDQSSDSCGICSKRFTLYHRRHHCRYVLIPLGKKFRVHTHP